MNQEHDHYGPWVNSFSGREYTATWSVALTTMFADPEQCPCGCGQRLRRPWGYILETDEGTRILQVTPPREA